MDLVQNHLLQRIAATDNRICILVNYLLYYCAKSIPLTTHYILRSPIKTGVLLLSLVLSMASLAQSKAEQIKAIGKEFRRINGDTYLKQVKLENEAFLTHTTDGGGSLTGYFKRGEIEKIHLWIGRSNGNEVKEYYFKNGQLIFVYEQFHSFRYDVQKEELDRTKTVTTFQGRYYFHHNKLLHFTTTGYNRLAGDALDPEKALLSEASDHVKLLTRKQ